MDLFEAILLGLIQGATEFLPISSSGHLLLIPKLLSIRAPGLSLISIVHEGTLLAVLVFFREDIQAIGKAFWVGLRERQPLASSESRLAWYIIVGSIPAAVAGLTMEDRLEKIFGRPMSAAIFLIGTAILLVAGERAVSGRKDLRELGWLDAIIIGLFQMLALLPGISRSGSTIAAGLWRGLNRDTAARYSFLLGIPAIVGAGLLAASDILAADDLGIQWPLLLASFSSAAISGYVCIRFLLNWLRNRSLYLFAAYCAVFGLLYLILEVVR